MRRQTFLSLFSSSKEDLSAGSKFRQKKTSRIFPSILERRRHGPNSNACSRHIFSSFTNIFSIEVVESAISRRLLPFYSPSHFIPPLSPRTLIQYNNTAIACAACCIVGKEPCFASIRVAPRLLRPGYHHHSFRKKLLPETL